MVNNRVIQCQTMERFHCMLTPLGVVGTLQEGLIRNAVNQDALKVNISSIVGKYANMLIPEFIITLLVLVPAVS